MSDDRPPAGKGWNAPGTCGGGYWRVVNGIYESWPPQPTPGVTVVNGVIYSMPPSKAPSSPVETTAASEQRPDHTGVIRPADAREARWLDALTGGPVSITLEKARGVILRACMAIADAENAALTTEVANLWRDWTHAQREVERLKAERIEQGAPISVATSMQAIGEAAIQAGNTAASVMSAAFDKRSPCPNSCGGQSWTDVNTNYGRRWRCDTCGRNISRYVTDAIQAADDRRAL